VLKPGETGNSRCMTTDRELPQREEEDCMAEYHAYAIGADDHIENQSR